MQRSPVPTATIDFLRGVAALYVVVNHTRGALFAGGQEMLATGHNHLSDKIAIGLLSLTSLGSEFVILFFVLSGFAMAHSIATSSGYADFYKKRAIRIWLPYIAAVGAALVVSALLEWVAPSFDPESNCSQYLCQPVVLLRKLFYLPTSTRLTPQFWSLPYEVLFYLACPFILASRRLAALTLAFSVFATAFAALRYGVVLNPTSSVLANFALNELLLFMCGACAYFWFPSLPKVTPPVLYLILAVGLTVVVLLHLRLGDATLWTNLIMIGLTLLTLRSLPDWWGRSRLNLGRYSYSIYLFHYAIIALISSLLFASLNITQHQMTNYGLWLAAIPPVMGVCFVGWYLAERPSVAWLSRIRQRETAVLVLKPQGSASP